MAFHSIEVARMGCLTQIQWAVQKAVALVKISSVVVAAVIVVAAVSVVAAVALVVAASVAVVAGVAILPGVPVVPVVPAAVGLAVGLAAVGGGMPVVDADTRPGQLPVQLAVGTG